MGEGDGSGVGDSGVGAGDCAFFFASRYLRVCSLRRAFNSSGVIFVRFALGLISSMESLISSFGGGGGGGGAGAGGGAGGGTPAFFALSLARFALDCSFRLSFNSSGVSFPPLITLGVSSKSLPIFAIIH